MILFFFKQKYPATQVERRCRKIRVEPWAKIRIQKEVPEWAHGVWEHMKAGESVVMTKWGGSPEGVAAV